MNFDKMIDKHAEATVIATLISHPEFILHTEYLHPGYFYDVSNGCIYWAIQELYKSGVTNIDAVNIENMLNSNKAVKRKMDEYNISNLDEYVSMCGYAARHTLEEYKIVVNQVVTMSFKRDLAKLASQIYHECENESLNLGDLNHSVNEKIQKLAEQYIVTEDVQVFGEKVENLWDEVISRRGDNGLYGLPSKFAEVNEYFTYEPGELVLLCAKMKRGKSALMMNEALHKVRMGVPTLYIDTEMSDRLFYERMLANLTQIEVKRIKTGRYSDEEASKILKANEYLKNAPFVHIYMPNPSDEEIYSLHKMLKYKMNLGFSVYDYIKGSAEDSSVLYQLLGARTDFLKNRIAGELQIPVLAGAQLNRGGEIADSIKLLQYCSVAAFWREKSKTEVQEDGLQCGNYCMNIGLNRLGEQMVEDDYLDFMFYGNTMSIVGAERHNKPQVF